MKLWSWGANTNGQLGHGFSSEQISRPTRVTTDIISQLLLLCRKTEENNKLEHSDSNTRKGPALKIHGGGTQVLICSLKPQGENTSSMLLYLGNETPIHVKNNVQSPESDSLMSSSTNPTVTFQPTLVSKALSIKSLSCGWDFNLLITESSEVYSWGNNKYGQLGRLTDSYESQIKLDPLPEFEAVQVSTGLRHAAAVGADGCLYIWGDNTKSQLGLSSSERIIWKPTKLTVKHENSKIPKFVNVKCGKSFTIALDSDGGLWGCGSNKFGQLGINPSSVIELTKVPWPSSGPFLSQEIHINDIVCGWNHVLILLSNGKVVSWGRNNFNQLGRSIKNSAKTTPVHPSHATVDSDFDPIPGYVEYIPEAIDSIACGSEHNLVLGVSGTVYSWGWNEHENCGVKSSRISTSEGGMKIGEDCVIFPTVVKFPDGAGKIIQVACGAGNGFAISE